MRAASLLFFETTVGVVSQITEVALGLDGPFQVTDGLGSARI
jgi:hypothetical protein